MIHKYIELSNYRPFFLGYQDTVCLGVGCLEPTGVDHQNYYFCFDCWSNSKSQEYKHFARLHKKALYSGGYKISDS